VFVGRNGSNPISVTTSNGVTSTITPVTALMRTQKDGSR
jgi:hypothetical protein